MKQVVLVRAGQVELQEICRPQLARGDVLIRVESCGVCGSDMVHFREASGPVSCWGHEIIGTVEAIGLDAERSLLGEVVAVRTTAPCEQCVDCQRGHQKRCGNWSRRAFNGFSDYISSPPLLLTPLPKLNASAFVLTEPLYVAMDFVEKSALEAGDSAVVVGAGPIGLMALHLLRQRGIAPVYVVHRRQSAARSELAERWGGVLLAREEFGRRAEKLGCHAALVTAPYNVIPSIVPAVRYAGRVVYNGITAHSKVMLDLRQLHLRKISLVPSFPHPQTSFAGAIAEIRSNHKQLCQMISHRIPLEHAHDAFKLLGGDLISAIKVVIVMR